MNEIWVLIWLTFGTGDQWCVDDSGKLRFDCKQNFLVTSSEQAILDKYMDIENKSMARLFSSIEFEITPTITEKGELTAEQKAANKSLGIQ